MSLTLTLDFIGFQIILLHQELQNANMKETPRAFLQAELRGHKLAVLGADFCPERKWIVTASYDKTARVWEAASGRELATLEGHTGSVWSAVFSPDGRSVVTAGFDATARIWKLANDPN